jgi:hypothetical protein
MLPESIKKIWLDLINNSSNANEGTKAKVDTTWAEIDKMLECIPADTDRQTWLNVAMAIPFSFATAYLF